VTEAAERLRTLIAHLDDLLDGLALARSEVSGLCGVFDCETWTKHAEAVAEWGETLECAQMDVGEVVHSLVSDAILAGLLPPEEP
jgi:hypothetical protein